MSANSTSRSSGSPSRNVSATKNSSAAGCANIISSIATSSASASLAADVELVALLIDLLRALLDLPRKDFVVRISDREFWTDLLQIAEVRRRSLERACLQIDRQERTRAAGENR